MTFDDGSLDKTYFEDFLNQISSHNDWKWQTGSWPSVDEAVEIASEGGTAEIELVHPDTDTVLYGMVPSEDHEHVLTGHTRQSLLLDPHPNQLPGPDSFEYQLADAYQSVAESHTTDYVTAAGNSEDLDFDLFRVQVPIDYSSTELQTAFDELSAAAEETYQLNQEIQNPVQQYLE